MSTKKAVSSVLRTGLFNGKAAIVTGGGTGIGKAISHELLYLGIILTLSPNSKVCFMLKVESCQ